MKVAHPLYMNSDERFVLSMSANVIGIPTLEAGRKSVKLDPPGTVKVPPPERKTPLATGVNDPLMFIWLKDICTVTIPFAR